MPDLAYRDSTLGGDNSLSVSSIVATPPTSVSLDGEFIICTAGVLSPAVAPTIATPAGWRLEATSGSLPIAGGVINVRAHVFTKISTGVESNVTLNAGVTAAITYVWGSYPNPEDRLFFAQAAFAAGGPSTSAVMSAITTTAANSLLVGFITQGVAQSSTPPSGMTEREDSATFGIAYADVIQASAGTTGTKTFTLPTSADYVYVFAEFRSANAPDPPTVLADQPAWAGTYGRAGGRDMARYNALLPTSKAGGLISANALFGAAVVGNSQALAITLDGVSSTVNQTATHPQSLAATLDGVTVSVAQTLNHSQALATTLDGVAVSIAQTAQHPQSLAITLDSVDVAINQSIGAGNSQAIAFTLDGVTVAVAQTVSHPQSLAVTLDGVTVAVAQTAQHPQALAVTLDGVTVAINQGLQHSQALAATLDGISVEIQQSVGSATKNQALAITLDDVSATVYQQSPAAPEVVPTYVVGKPKKNKERKLMGGPRWQRHELEDLRELVQARPFEEAQAEQQAREAIAKASEKQEIDALSSQADAQLAQSAKELARAQEIQQQIDQQREDEAVMQIIAELL